MTGIGFNPNQALILATNKADIKRATPDGKLTSDNKLDKNEQARLGETLGNAFGIKLSPEAAEAITSCLQKLSNSGFNPFKRNGEIDLTKLSEPNSNIAGNLKNMLTDNFVNKGNSAIYETKNGKSPIQNELAAFCGKLNAPRGGISYGTPQG